VRQSSHSHIEATTTTTSTTGNKCQFPAVTTHLEEERGKKTERDHMVSLIVVHKRTNTVLTIKRQLGGGTHTWLGIKIQLIIYKIIYYIYIYIWFTYANILNKNFKLSQKLRNKRTRLFCDNDCLRKVVAAIQAASSACNKTDTAIKLFQHWCTKLEVHAHTKT
jgi:hypothetical protein